MQPLTWPARRIPLTLCCLALALVLAGGCTDRSPGPQPETPNETGTTQTPNLLVDRVEAALPDDSPLRAAWAADLEGRGLTRLWLPPEEADPGYLLVHTDRNELVAVNREDGIPLWWTVLEAPVSDTPAFSPYALYVIEDKMLTCLEIESGQVLWRLPLPFAASAGPVVQEIQAGQPNLLIPGLDRRLHALITETEVWPPSSGTHYIKRDDITINRTRLREIWHVRLSGAIAGRPIRAGDRVYTADANNRIYAIDPTRIKLKVPENIEKFTAQGPLIATPAQVGELVVFSSLDRSLYALDSRVANRKWTAPTGYRLETSPVELLDPFTATRYVGCRFGTEGPYGLLNAEDGTLAWESPGGVDAVALFVFRENPDSSRAVAILHNADGSLTARGVTSGEELWRVPAGDFGPYALNTRFPTVFTVMNGRILSALERDF